MLSGTSSFHQLSLIIKLQAVSIRKSDSPLESQSERREARRERTTWSSGWTSVRAPGGGTDTQPSTRHKRAAINEKRARVLQWDKRAGIRIFWLLFHSRVQRITRDAQVQGEPTFTHGPLEMWGSKCYHEVASLLHLTAVLERELAI